MPCLVSIIIPARNSARWIDQAIDSVLGQEDPDIEIIVIDGASSDGTVERLAARAGEPRIRWISEPDHNQSHALNKGFAMARGDILAWLCADDFYLPGALAEMRRHLTDGKGRRLFYGNGIKANPDESVREAIDCGPMFDCRRIVDYNHVFSTSAFWTRELWEASGGYVDEGNELTMDWELFIRMSRHGEFVHSPVRIAALRIHDETKTSASLRQRRERQREIVRVSRRHGGAFCFNSLIYPAVRFAGLAAATRSWPRPLHSLAHRFFYLPLVLLAGRRHSMLLDRPKSDKTAPTGTL